MLSLLMTTEYAQAEERYELQRLLLRVAGGEREAPRSCINARAQRCTVSRFPTLKTRTTRRT